MRDGDGGIVPAQQRRQGLVDQRLRLGVQGRGGFVEDQDIRVLDQGARDGDALLLSARQLRAARPDVRVQPVGEVAQELAVCLAGRGVELRAGCARFAVRDVLGDCTGEEHRLLGDDADFAAQLFGVQGADVDAVDLDGAGGGRVETQQEMGDGGFAAARGADDGDV